MGEQIKVTFTYADEQEHSLGLLGDRNIEELIDSFPWAEEQERAFQLQQCAPGINFKRENPDVFFDISAYEGNKSDPTKLVAMLVFSTPFEKKGWFRTKSMIRYDDYTIDETNLAKAKTLARLFADGAYEELIKRFPAECYQVYEQEVKQ